MNQKHERVALTAQPVEVTMEPLAVSAAEAARLLGVSKPTIYQYVGRADFPSFKLGTRTLISVDGLRAWVEKQSRGEAGA